jgi:hypothetical protein
VPQITEQINLSRQTPLVFNNTNTSVIVSSPTPRGNATLIIKNITGSPDFPTQNGFTGLLLLNLSIITKNPFVNIEITTRYPCAYQSSRIFPYQYVNQTWSIITPFSVSNSTCTVSFTVSKNSTVGIFYSNAKINKPDLGLDVLIAVLVIVAIIAAILAFDDVKGRRRLRGMLAQRQTR